MATAKSTYIVGPLYDSVFFTLSPLLALGLGILIAVTRMDSKRIMIYSLDYEASLPGLFIGSFVAAHLFIVFFRSNANRKIFELYPYRFTVVPVLLFVSMCANRWWAIAMGVLAIWWDVYHSSLQTFGIGRIYDVRRGNDVSVGRRLDFVLNLFIYAGPILAGATLMMHSESFLDFEEVQSLYFARVGDYLDSNQIYLRWIILGTGIPFVAYYFASYWRFHKQGYKIAWQKVLLLSTTTVCSIYTWGFNSFGEAFFIMNFFHAFQYFGIVWWSEKKSMMSLFRLKNVIGGKAVTVVLFVGIAFAYGVWAEAVHGETHGAAIDYGFNAVIVVSLMHFWYDGFIWSVRKKQV